MRTLTMRRLHKDEERKLLHACSLDEVFPLLHGPLRQIEQEHDELSPVEVWIAAIDFSNQLLEMYEPEIELPYLVSDLKEACPTENGAFLIMLASAYRLAPLRKKDERVVEIIVMLMPYYIDHPLYRDLMLEIGDVEDKRRWKGKQIDLWEYQLRSIPAIDNEAACELEHKVMSDFAEVAMLSNAVTLANIVNVFSEFNDSHQGRFSDILDRLRKKLHELDQPVGRGLTYIKQQTVAGDQNMFRDESSLAKFELPQNLTPDKLLEILNNPQFNQLTNGEQVNQLTNGQ